RVDLGVRMLSQYSRPRPAHYPLMCEAEVVGRDLSCDRQAFFLGAADELDATGRTDMGDMDAPTGLAGEGDVAGNHAVLGGGRIALEAEAGAHPTLVHDPACTERLVFTMVDNGQIEGAGIFESPAHNRGVRHRGA